MARLDNGLADLPLPISTIEIALHDYAYNPQRGLEKLYSALLSFQNASQSRGIHSLYGQRLNSVLTAVDSLLVSGSPYFSHYHSALLSTVDALFQVVMACQFGSDRSQQLDSLLSDERSCWSVVMSIADEKDVSLLYRNYEARLDSAQLSSMSVDAYLEAFSSAGRVSFQLDSVKGSRLSGRFLLISVQPLSWLRRRFPSLQWQVLSVNEKEPLRTLCELSFLPLFQNITMSRNSRNRLLALFEERFQTLFYRVFGSYFSLDLTRVDQAERLVPCTHNVVTFEQDENLTYFPIRHGGLLYMGSHTEAETSSYVQCLGRDYLSYFLYEIDTSYGRFVFDQAECLGCYDVVEEDFILDQESIWFKPEQGVKAEVILNVSLISSRDSAFCPLLGGISQVLIVKQEQCYFALPYLLMREIEAVCSMMSAPRSWVKNIWLSQNNAPLLEPWLLNKRTLPQNNVWSEKNKSTLPSKNGYYFGKVYGRMLWVDANLILALLPYEAPSSVVHCEEDWLRSKAFFIHDGRSFDKVIPEEPLYTEDGSFLESNAFSIILEWMGESIVLSLASCEWSVALPESNDYIRDASLIFDDAACDTMISRFASLQDGDLVINKKNYLSFAAGFWPSSSLA